MTRGKYAAKANGQRAEAAANTVVALRGQLDQERRERMAEVAALKTEIALLQGRLLREVQGLAAAEIKRVQNEARESIDIVHADVNDRLQSVARILKKGLNTPNWWADVAKILAVPIAEVMPGQGSASQSRAARRVSGSQIRAWSSAGCLGYSPLHSLTEVDHEN